MRFFIPGVPVPQGSMKAVQRGGRAFVVHDNPNLHAWRSTIAEQAQRERDGELHGALSVELRFLLPRPRTRKDPFPSSRPDIDKLARAVLDGLSDGGVWKDDAQVVSLVAHKRFVEDPNEAGCSVLIRHEEAA